ncbi:MAG: AAA family ATPase, partial [Kiritimatiellae bacterium]|nr:AAA family ATPase [Kiritimatiellia bacterium]
EQLLEAACELNEAQEAPKSAACGLLGGGADNQPSRAAGAATGATSGDCGDFAVRPGDDFCQRGEIRPILESHGWQLLGSRQDGNELWRRPGKESGGHSATFDGNVFYVFSSNAAPFESERGYSRFQVYATLECGGDYTRAARELLGKGYGQTMPEPGVDFSRLRTASGQQQGGGQQQGAADGDCRPPSFLPLGELVEKYPKMRPVLIHGFLRRGETMNIIAPPKTGKSWLVTDLALSVATGTPWFGFPCEKGKVLIIDNELHPETSANRIPKVVAARGFDLKKVQNDIYVDNQRGRLGNIEDLANQIETLKPYGFKLVIIDAFYRALPKGTDENDNGTVAGLYNLIDKYAAALDCAFVLIHHTSKGNQSLKSITDVGAGAGSQSRASDTHVILRRHKEEGCVVMESVVRSFPSVGAVCLRWDWPLWERDDSLNPEDLDGKKEDRPTSAGDPDPSAIASRLAEVVQDDPPMVKGVFIEAVKTFYGITLKTARLAVESAIAGGYIKCERLAHPPDGQHAAKFIVKGDVRMDSLNDDSD